MLCTTRWDCITFQKKVRSGLQVTSQTHNQPFLLLLLWTCHSWCPQWWKNTKQRGESALLDAPMVVRLRWNQTTSCEPVPYLTQLVLFYLFIYFFTPQTESTTTPVVACLTFELFLDNIRLIGWWVKSWFIPYIYIIIYIIKGHLNHDIIH